MIIEMNRFKKIYYLKKIIAVINKYQECKDNRKQQDQIIFTIINFQKLIMKIIVN